MKMMALLGSAGRRGAGRAAGLVRALAGMPAGASRTRRGTVLVLILGALALIAVLTIVYVSVGQGDRRAAARVVRSEGVDTVARRFADYFADVIARSTVATAVDGSRTVAGVEKPVLYHPFYDYPFTDPSRKSIVKDATGNPVVAPELRFNVTGSDDAIWGPQDVALGGNTDPRLFSTPWLSSTEPSKDPALAGSTNPNDPTMWPQISQLSPDARFVNLWTLAPVINNVRYSAWDARSEFDPAIGPQQPQFVTIGGITKVDSQISFGLPLLDPNGDPYDPTSPISGVVAANIPALWSTNQQGLFRPARGPQFYPDPVPTDPVTGLNANSPASMWYAPYLFADADGDGFFDSRWFELIDASDPTNIRSLLPRDDRFRWFAAAKVTDLSALVNVNTAMDFVNPPGQLKKGTNPQVDQVRPLGTAPEVDLARLLKMVDTYYVYTGGASGGAWTVSTTATGYQLLHRPNPPTVEDYSGYDWPTSQKVGAAAYESIRWVLSPNSVEVPDAGFTFPPAFGGGVLFADERVKYYERSGSWLFGAYIPKTTATATDQHVELNARFNLADLQELLTTRGVNNPLTTSRLEQAADGRGTGSPGPDFGPLRSNRGSIDGYLVDPPSPTTAGTASPDAIARARFDIRQRLTTYNRARDFLPMLIDESGKSVVSAAESTRVNAVDALHAAIAYSNDTANPALDGRYKDRDPSSLFQGYAQALLPYAFARLPNAWANPRYATLAYGGNPELALRIAAHMTVNLMDSARKAKTTVTTPGEDQPTAVSVLVDNRARDAVAGQPGSHEMDLKDSNQKYLFPWWHETGTTTSNFPGRLDLGAANLANPVPLVAGAAQDTVSCKAYNVYGIQAQPVITEVASIFLYTDAPHNIPAPSGDDEYVPNENHEITINGTIEASGGSPTPNPDYLGSVLAFQLTNPFDVDIRLTAPDKDAGAGLSGPEEDSSFYLEYGGSFYKLAEWDETVSQLKAVVLRAGESRVFYVLSNPVSDMTARWSHVYPTTGAMPQKAVTDFLNRQFAVEKPAGVTEPDVVLDGQHVRPIRVLPVNANGAVQNAATAFDLFPNNAATKAKKTVHLWRRMQSPTNPGASANRSYDLLVDRLRDPAPLAENTLYQMMPASNKNIGGTVAGDETTGAPLDNTGFTIALWGDFKRRDDPGALTGVPRGAIPAYCVEAKWGSSPVSTTTLTNKDRKLNDGTTNPFSLIKQDFIRSPSFGAPPGRRTFDSWVGTFAASSATPPSDANVLIWTMVEAASKKHRDPIVQNLNGRDYKDLYPEIYLDGARYEKDEPTVTGTLTPKHLSVLRVADMLLPLGIGPCYMPLSDSANPGGQTAGLEPIPDTIAKGGHEGRITLTEALGLALNYTAPTGAGIGGATDPYSLYMVTLPGGAQARSIGDEHYGALDRGNLVLDRVTLDTTAGQTSARLFVPFEDTNADGVFDPGADLPRFPRIPLAMHILDVFTTFPAPLASGGVPGRLNLNTVGQNLGLVSMLAPTPEKDGSGSVWDTWIKNATNSTSLPPKRILPTTDFDCASGLLGYRDRTVLDDRSGRKVHFEDSTGAPFDSLSWDGRFLTTRIAAQREAPGFASIGEILASNYLAPSGGAPTHTVPFGDQILYLGRDHDGEPAGGFTPGTLGLDSGVLGTNTSSYKDRAVTPAVAKPDTIPNNYAEKLLVASGALNSLTTRSDVFAVWFLVNGYTKADTENLRPQTQQDFNNGVVDPLTPSVQKRFLMVIDRSNVTVLGQKPKVLLFTEVPIANQ